MGKIRFWIENNTLGWGIFWHVVIALALVAAVTLANTFLAPQLSSLPAFFVASSEQTTSLLVSLSGALMTVTIFLYSTTVVVLTTYSAQFTPRVIENFSNNKGIARIFGIFIGGTIYCMLSLFFVSRTENDVTFLAAAVGIVYVLLCVFHFIVFIVTVSSSVQVQNLLTTLAKQASDVVDRFVESRQETVRLDSFPTEQYAKQRDLHARDNGFFEENDIRAINSTLQGEEYTIVLYPRIGDWISRRQRIATLYYNDLVLNQHIRDNLANALILEDKRYIDNDYIFAIQKIVEVALKALSFSINDPNTAIYCIRHLGVLAGKLAGIDGQYAEILPDRDRGDAAKIVDQDFMFDRDLRDIFIQIIHYGKGDIYVAAAIVDALYTAWLVSTENNKPAIEHMVEYLYAQIDGLYTYPLEFDLLDQKRELFSQDAQPPSPANR